MALIGNDKWKIGRLKETLVFIIEHKRLYGGNNNLRFPPIVYVLLEYDRVIVGSKIVMKIFLGLIFKLNSIHQEKHPIRISATQEKTNYGSRSESLTCTGCHLKQEPLISTSHRFLQGFQRIDLILTEKS